MAGMGVGSSGAPTDRMEDSPSGASTRGPHRLSAVRVCERKWAFRYHWDFRPPARADKDWRLGGTLIHLCLAYYYASRMPVETQPHWFKVKDLYQALKDEGQGRDHVIESAKASLAAYMQEYAADDIRPMWIEKEWTAKLGELDPGGPWPELDDEEVTCRSDLVYELTRSGFGNIMDHKSFGVSKTRRDGTLVKWSPDGEFSLNWQILVNLQIVRAELLRMGRDPTWLRGFVIQRCTRNSPYVFDRNVVPISQAAYSYTPRLLRKAVKMELDLMARIEAGDAPDPNYDACYGKYGPCDYIDVCRAATDEQAKAVLLRDFERKISV